MHLLLSQSIVKRNCLNRLLSSTTSGKRIIKNGRNQQKNTILALAIAVNSVTSPKAATKSVP